MNKTKSIIASAALIAAGIGTLAACGTTTTHTVVKTVKVAVPGPVTTKTVTVKVPVPGPTKTIIKTKTVQAPPPPTGSKIFGYTGSGNENTPAFNVPGSGDYIVSWTFSGNSDGFGNGDNFNITATNQGLFSALGLPNDIADSGHGSTEITGDSGAESFNVQAADSSTWTISIVSAS